MKIQKNCRGDRVGGSGSEGSQCRCERRSEVFVNIQQTKKLGGAGGSGRGVRLRGKSG